MEAQFWLSNIVEHKSRRSRISLQLLYEKRNKINIKYIQKEIISKQKKTK